MPCYFLAQTKYEYTLGKLERVPKARIASTPQCIIIHDFEIDCSKVLDLLETYMSHLQCLGNRVSLVCGVR